MLLDELKKLAQEARDSDQPETTQAYIEAIWPERLLRMIAAIEAAKAMQEALDNYGTFPAPIRAAILPLRASLEELERGKT